MADIDHDIYTYICVLSVGPSRLFKIQTKNIGVINDPLGQPTTVQEGSDFRFILKSWDGRTTCVNIVITTGRNCKKCSCIASRVVRLAEWIINYPCYGEGCLKPVDISICS